MKSILQLLVLSVLALCVTAQVVQQWQMGGEEEEALIEQGPWQQQVGYFVEQGIQGQVGQFGGEEALVDEMGEGIQGQIGQFGGEEALIDQMGQGQVGQGILEERGPGRWWNRGGWGRRGRRGRWDDDDDDDGWRRRRRRWWW